jgi:hypothetical protein
MASRVIVLRLVSPPPAVMPPFLREPPGRVRGRSDMMIVTAALKAVATEVNAPGAVDRAEA